MGIDQQEFEINTFFSFHAVGQGLFYSGRLTTQEGIYNFVYDCGSHHYRRYHKALNQEIQQYLEGLENGGIDLLILSHLHEDHVSGLGILLERESVRSCIDTVILPYFSPLERIVIAINS